MLRKFVTAQVVRDAGIPVVSLVEDDDLSSDLYEAFSEGEVKTVWEGDIEVNGVSLCAATTATHCFVFFQEYALLEDGTESDDEDDVDLFMVNVFTL